MGIKNLEIYASYFDTKEFSAWLAQNGADSVKETQGNIETGAASDIRLGGVLRSVREHHANRLAEVSMEPIEFIYHSVADAPTVPSDAYWAGVLYLEEPKVGDIEIMPIADLEYSGTGMVLTMFWRNINPEV